MRLSQISGVGSALIAPFFLYVATGFAGAAEDPAEAFDAAGARLEAIGGLSAINAQHTYLLIGVVSDAHIKGIYEPKQVRSMMNGVIRQLETLSGMLRKLQKGELSADDNEYVERVIAVHVKLQSQARALNNFVEKKGEAEARAFEKSRRASLKDLETLLGAEKSASEEPDESPPAPPVEKPDSK